MDHSKYITLSSILIWSQLQYFNPGEDWGNYEKMDSRLLWNLDQVRKELVRKISVHCGFEVSGHAPNSFHKLGMSVDFHVENTEPEELYDLYRYFLMVWHGGVGVYPFWNHVGFHLDIGPDRTWVRDKDGKYYSDSDKIIEITRSIIPARCIMYDNVEDCKEPCSDYKDCGKFDSIITE